MSTFGLWVWVFACTLPMHMSLYAWVPTFLSSLCNVNILAPECLCLHLYPLFKKGLVMGIVIEPILRRSHSKLNREMRGKWEGNEDFCFCLSKPSYLFCWSLIAVASVPEVQGSQDLGQPHTAFQQTRKMDRCCKNQSSDSHGCLHICTQMHIH